MRTIKPNRKGSATRLEGRRFRGHRISGWRIETVPARREVAVAMSYGTFL